MEITGKVISILDVQKFVSKKNGNEYVRCGFVLETTGEYPKRVAFTVMGQEKFASMGILVGGSYNISFDVESRSWNDKWFTDCMAWRAVRLDESQSNGTPAASVVQSSQVLPQSQMPYAPSPQMPDNAPVASNANDSLPF